MQRKEYKRLKQWSLFKIKDSMEIFTPINDILTANRPMLDFNIISEEIPVEEETSEIICIGNISRKRLKIQFSVMEGCDQYQIRSEPQLITLTKGKAFEFEVFIKPLCTCRLYEQIVISAVDIKTGEEHITHIKIRVKTMQSTRLDYRELKEDKKIGEGTFGTVYLGKYRDHDVAIKKMKTIDDGEGGDDERQMQEFEREVKMLDKIRCEHIIHFYGAVMIPTKVCMVTEYATFGSLQTLLEKRAEQPLNEKMRLKMVLDAALGIDYLHQNGILHRDIKPDNFLIVSLEEDIRANCKLTDFGSARNTNALMTNLTFTKGIGTPAYMAPEILKKQKYKKPADVYAFAITMYEVLSWTQAYPKKQFKFPWKIAEFVVSGNRMEKCGLITDKQFELIEHCWCNLPSDRFAMEFIVSALETELLQIKLKEEQNIFI